MTSNNRQRSTENKTGGSPWKYRHSAIWGSASDKLEDWSAISPPPGSGCRRWTAAAATRAFRMDDRKQRLFVDRAIAAGAKVFGWEVADAAALDALAARLEQAGVAVKREPAALADQRCVAGLISFADPAGNRLEAFHGAMIADAPFRPGRDIAGLPHRRAGHGARAAGGAGHRGGARFYCDLLGFRVSDYMTHADPRLLPARQSTPPQHRDRRCAGERGCTI